MKKVVSVSIVATVAVMVAVGGYLLYETRSQPVSEIGKTVQNFFAFESRDVGSVSDPTESSGRETDVGETNTVVSSPLRKVSEAPVAGAVALLRDGERYIRYIEKETGHVYEARATSTALERITNTTIPRVAEALWAPDGTFVVLRYLEEDWETITTFLATITAGAEAPASEGSLVGTFLAQDINSIDINDSGTSLFFTVPENDGSEGVRVTPPSSKTTRVFSSPLREWSVRYAGEALMLATKPSASVPGFLYEVSPVTGSFIRLLGDINGLSSLASPGADFVLFSESTVNGLLLSVSERATKETLVLPTSTLAEKCVWSREEPRVAYCLVPESIPSGAYPDLWYQGRVSFSDNIWKIDTETGRSSLLAVPTELVGESLDGMRPELSPDESVLIFINKKDSSLWSLVLP